MSIDFFQLNCASPSKIHAPIQPWIVSRMIQGINRPLIIDTGCNVTAVPLTITKLLNFWVQPTDIQVTIVDGSTYRLLGSVAVTIHISGTSATVNAIVSSGYKVPSPLTGWRKLQAYWTWHIAA